MVVVRAGDITCSRLSLPAILQEKKHLSKIMLVPGRAGAFRPLFPLRTVRDSFPSHGSSP